MAAFVTNIYIFLVILLVSLFVFVECLERDVTINVQPGAEECFYESLKTDEILEIEYQVIDGGQGELDITFHLTAPGGKTLIRDYKKPENNHRVEIKIPGDYRLCFDNRFSSFNSKTVYFEVIIESAEEEKDPWDDLDEMTSEEVYEMQIQDIEEAVNRVKAHVIKIRHLQELVRATEARDRKVAEGNFTLVNIWSSIQIFVMLVVGVIQVIMVKSLFDEKSKVHRLWKYGFTMR